MGGVKVADHRIESEGGQIYGRLYAPEQEGSFPAVIIGHGYNGSHLDWTEECSYFAEKGYIAYAYDFRGGSNRSKSSLKTTEMTMETEVSDVCAAFDEISAFPTVKKDRVFLMGGSMGGFASALAAEKISDRAAGMILYFPALCIPDNWRENYPEDSTVPETLDFWEMRIGGDYIRGAKNIQTFERIGHFSGPVLLLHGTEDEVVPISYSEKAVQTYPKAELVSLPGEKHGFSPEGSKLAMKKALEFMERVQEGGAGKC